MATLLLYPKFFTTSLLLLILTPRITTALSYPCPFNPTESSSKPIPAQANPSFPEQFSVHVEANVVNQQLTSEAVQIYDHPNKRAVMVVTTNNNTVTSLYDYVAGERLVMGSNGSCASFNISSAAFDVFGFTELPASVPVDALAAAPELFRFGQNQPKVYLGETTVRGIPVDHWQSCQKLQVGNQDSAAYVADYFFSRRGYGTASAEGSVPVRVVFNGTVLNAGADGNPGSASGAHNFSHVYDFSFFRPGPVDDESLFEVPRGTVCSRVLTKTMPKLPDRFSLSMEVYVPGSIVPPLTERMLFDYDFKLIQTTRYAPRVNARQYGLTELTIVEDYEHHVQYVMDAYDGNCTVSSMPHGLSTSMDDGEVITMRHGEQMLNFRRQGFQYQGQKWYRDMKVDVWADSSQSGMVQEVYFLAGWPSEHMRQRITMRLGPDIDFSTMSMLVGTYLINTTAVKGETLGPMFKLMDPQALRQWGDSWKPGEGAGSKDSSRPNPGELLRTTLNRRPGMAWRMHLATATEKFINVFNYLPMHMDLSAFDISLCYKKTAGELYVYLEIDGSYAEMVSNQRFSFLSSAKAAIAAAAGVSSLRVAKINVWQDLTSSRINFFFSLLEPPSFSMLGTEDQNHPQLSCKEAYEKLGKVVQQGLTIVVKHPLSQTPLYVIHDSLKSWSSLDVLFNRVASGTAADPRKDPANSYAQTQHGSVMAAPDGSDSSYSQSQFGGMAFGMLLLGILVGVVGVYVALRKLRPDIHLLPYQQSK